MVYGFPIQHAQDAALTPLDEGQKPLSLSPPFAFLVLPPYYCLVDTGLRPVPQVWECFVSESEEPFACTTVCIGEEVPKQGEGVPWSATRGFGTATSGYARAEDTTWRGGSHGGRLLMLIDVKAEAVRTGAGGRHGITQL